MKKTTLNLLRSGAAPLALILAGAAGSMMIAAPAAAQDYTNVTASGRIVGADGAAIPNATITIVSNGQGFERVVTADKNGSYRVPQLPSGSYTFTVSAPGFEPYTDNNVDISADTAASQFTLVPAGSLAEIVVTAGRIQVADFERTTVGSVIKLGELAERIPVARNISDVVQLSPGTTAGDSAFGAQPNIAGSSVAENIFYLNGLNITNFRTGLGAAAIPFDFYDTVEIKNGGFQAEFGRTTGGVVNAISKAGSNTFHGGITFNWEPDALSSRRPNTIFEDNDAREFERTDMVAELSGPVIKDHLFFYGLYNFRNVESRRNVVALASTLNVDPAAVVGRQYSIDRSTDPFYAFKVDAVITDGQRLEFTYFNSTAKTTRTLFGTAASGDAYDPVTNDPGNYDSTVVFGSGGENYVARYTGVFTPWLTISAAYGVNKDRDTTESTTPGTPSIIDERSGVPQSLGNPSANADLSTDKREFYRADVDLFVNLLGSHHFRAGYDRENLTTNIVTLANGGGQYTYSAGAADNDLGFLSGDYVTVRFFRNGGEFKSTNEAFYLQDNWSLLNDRIQLQLGVRNDRFINRNIAGTPFYKSGDQWAPRLGFSADVFGDKQTKLYGSFGRYYLPIAANTNNRLGGAELDYDTFYTLNGLKADQTPILGAQLAPLGGSPCPTGPGSCIIRSDGVPIPVESAISQQLNSQSLDEYIVGIEHRLTSDIKFGLYYTKRDLTSTLEDAAVDAAIRNYCNQNNLNAPNGDGDTCQDIFNGTHQYVLLNPGGPATITLSDPVNGESTLRTVEFSAADLGIPAAVRKYWGLTFTAERTFDGVWGMSGSYTYSSLRGNTEGGVRSDNGQDDTGATVDFDLPGLADGTFGYSPNHRRHNLKFYGSYAPTKWLTLGLSAQLISPRKFGCLGTVPASRDPDAARFYGANGTYCNIAADGSIRTTPFTPGEVIPARQVVPRGTVFESDWLKSINFDARFQLPTDAFDGFFRVTVNNVLNSKAKLDFEERGTLTSGAPRTTYGQIRDYQSPRSVRLQLGVKF